MAAAAVQDDTFRLELWRAFRDLPLDGLPHFWRPTKSNAYPLADNCGIKLDVECYSGHKADERPVRFTLEGAQYSVEAVLDQWYGPESVYFRVRADDGNLYILRQQVYSEQKTNMLRFFGCQSAHAGSQFRIWMECHT
jgi:hypothetical protein